MRTDHLLIILCFAGLLYLMRDGEPTPEVPDTVWNPPGTEWDSDRQMLLTPEMLDTMTFTGGHWYGNSNLPNTHRPIREKPRGKKHKVQWIRPVGNDYHYRNSKEAERAWRQMQAQEAQQQEDLMDQQLTEDDVRVIIDQYLK